MYNRRMAIEKRIDRHTLNSSGLKINGVTAIFGPQLEIRFGSRDGTE